MMRRILTIINKEISGLHQAAYLLGFFSFLSQLLALVRDRLLAGSFGASHSLDIYYAAFRFPDFVFVGIASLVSISVLIPALIKKLDHGVEETRAFLSGVFTLFSGAIIVVSGVLYVAMPWLVDWFFPGFIGQPLHGELITLSRILLLSPFFLGVSNFFASITQVYNRFFVYALSPLLYNSGIIIGIVCFYPLWGLQGLAWGVILGAGMHFLIQVPFVFEKELFPKITIKIHLKEIWQVVSQSVPRTITLSANEVAEFLLISFASMMSVGAISVYNLSWNLQSVPLSIIGVSYSLAAFPALTKLYNTGEKKQFLTQVQTSARHIIFLTMPLVVLFIVLRAQIVRTVLGSGEFSWSDTRLTAAALAVFAISLIPQSLNILFVRAFYSKGNTRYPLIINTLSSIGIIALAYCFIQVYLAVPMIQYFFDALLRLSDVGGSEVLMLPLAYSVGVTINMVLLWSVFQKEFTEFSWKVLRTFIQVFSVSVLMGGVAYFGLIGFGLVLNTTTTWGIFLQGLFSGIVACSIGALFLKLMNSVELAEMWQTLHRKIWKAPVIVPEQKELVQ